MKLYNKDCMEMFKEIGDASVDLFISDVPYIENVKNKKRMLENGIFDLIIKYDLCYQFVGRHIYQMS